MTVYIINILLTIIIALAAQRNTDERGLENNELDGAVNKVSLIGIVAICVLWSLVYALRGVKVGADTSGYISHYRLAAKTDLTLLEYVSSYDDVLFYGLRYIFAKILHASWVQFSLFTGILTYVPVLFAIRRKCTDHFIFSVLLYIFMLHFYTGFNGVRQAIAVSLSFFAYCIYFEEKKYIKYIICMVCALGFHSTALFVIPLHFLSKLKFNSKVLWSIIGALFVSGIAFSSLWNAAIDVLSLVGNDMLAERYAEVSYDGSGYLRILVCLAPVIVALFGRKLLTEKENIDRYIIFMILDACFMFLSTRNWLFGRIAIYMDIYAIILIPKLKISFDDDSKSLAMIAIGGLYFLYMIIMLLHGEGNYYPYTFISM